LEKKRETEPQHENQKAHKQSQEQKANPPQAHQEPVRVEPKKTPNHQQKGLNFFDIFNSENNMMRRRKRGDRRERCF
ncbi:hypothetical protein, partial [Citrobacter freundii]|uniref:hypothetical protein n=1 Tax=Citrobacter freundii TaxID=546 RepID=UPI00193AEB95